VVLAGVSRYTDLATQVRQACGMADGWQRVDLRRRQIADYALLVDGDFAAAERRRTTGNVLATCHVAAMSSIAVAERHRREIRGTSPMARVR
jgi:hypothetical protein